MLRNLRVNIYGLFGFVLIVTMIVIRMLQVDVPQDTSNSNFVYRLLAAILDPYVLLSLVPYVGISLLINRRLDSRTFVTKRLSTEERLRYQNVFIGAQIAFALLVAGLLLGLGNFLWQLIYYIIVVSFGLLVPFQLLSRGDDAPSKKDEDKLEF